MKKGSTNKELKIKLRDTVLKQFKHPKVCDLFCGSKEMYNEVWKDAEKYIGVDKIQGQNNIKWIRENDVSQYNIFDLDAYANPFPALIELQKKELCKRYAVILTDYIAFQVKIGGGLPECFKKFVTSNNRKYYFYHYDELLCHVLKSLIKGKIAKYIVLKEDNVHQLHYSAFFVTA